MRYASYLLSMPAFIYTRGKDEGWSHVWTPSLNHFHPRRRLRGCSDRERADRVLGQVST